MNLPELEALRVRRYNASVTRNEILTDAVAQSRARNFKKGDVVFSVCVSQPHSVGQVATISAREIVLTSLGKVQGTATYPDNGKNTLVRVHRNFDILCSTREEVEAFAAKIGNVAHEEGHLGSAYCTLANLINYPHLKERCEPEILARVAAADSPSYKVVFS